MYKKYFIFLVFIFIVVLVYNYFTYFLDKNNVVSTYSYEKNLKDKVISSPVIATINKDTKIYNDMDFKNYVGELLAGESVEILKDHSKKFYLVKTKKFKGWVKRQDINIPKDPKTNLNKLKDREIEDYINYSGLKSKTNFLIWVDIDRQLTYILKKSSSKWKLNNIFVCSTGINESPTTRGVFQILDRGEWFYSERLGSGAKYWIRFNGSYLFHSVAMDKNKNIIDNNLGVRRSNGCVRMSIENIKWIYDNIPEKTTVFIN